MKFEQEIKSREQVVSAAETEFKELREKAIESSSNIRVIKRTKENKEDIK